MICIITVNDFEERNVVNTFFFNKATLKILFSTVLYARVYFDSSQTPTRRVSLHSEMLQRQCISTHVFTFKQNKPDVGVY